MEREENTQTYTSLTKRLDISFCTKLAKNITYDKRARYKLQ